MSTEEKGSFAELVEGIASVVREIFSIIPNLGGTSHTTLDTFANPELHRTKLTPTERWNQQSSNDEQKRD